MNIALHIDFLMHFVQTDLPLVEINGRLSRHKSLAQCNVQELTTELCLSAAEASGATLPRNFSMSPADAYNISKDTPTRCGRLPLYKWAPFINWHCKGNPTTHWENLWLLQFTCSNWLKLWMKLYIYGELLCQETGFSLPTLHITLVAYLGWIREG